MINKQIFGAFLAFGLTAISAGFAQAETLTLVGPALPNHNLGWPSTGIQITSLQDVTLNSFTFANYGAQDTIELTDSNNNVLHTYSFAAGTGDNALINANWQLSANTTYRLISLDPNNSKWNNGSFPVANAHIRVDGGYGQGSVQPYWFHFTNLTTTNTTTTPVPEPETYAMMLAGLAALAVIARRKRQA